MRLETVSKVKGWVALAGLCLWILISCLMDRKAPSSAAILAGGFSGLIGIVYSVKWARLRRRMREWEYQRGARARG